MNWLNDELRLLTFAAVQSLVLFACWRFVSRHIAGRLQRLIDTLLLTYLVQYIAVGLPGLIGFLSPIAMLVTATLLAIGLLFLTRISPPREIQITPATRSDPLIILTRLLLVIGYVAAIIWQLRLVPPLATDALTYHLPAAVQWLQHGRIDVFQTWFFNPANTYSPLAGSMFYAWLLGPIGNDTLALFATAPMPLLIFLAVVAIARSLGASTVTAVLAGLAIALSRPIVSQIGKGKDDLFLAAFFAVAVASLSPRRLRDPFGPWRIGIAIGLCLAVKYTALLAMPMLLLAIDAPFRALWKRNNDNEQSGHSLFRFTLIAVACVFVIAGPWYVRNVLLTGNPLFPADFLWFKGLFSTARSFELRLFIDVMWVFTNGPFAVPGALIAVLLAAWCLGVVNAGPRAISEPLVRLCLFGPPIGVAMFIWLSPYPEVRFIVPPLILMVAGLAAIKIRWSWLPAGLVLLVAVVTAISSNLWLTQLTSCLVAVLLAGLGVGVVLLQSRYLRLGRDRLLLIAGVVALLIAGYAYVFWSAFVGERQILATKVWRSQDLRGPLWAFVRDELPAGEPIAYTATATIYPLMGYALDRPVVYVPIRPGVSTLANLPRLGDHLAGEQIQPAAIAATIDHADRDVWLANLRASGARYLVVFFNDAVWSPVEQTWAETMPKRFEQQYADRAGAVYRIRQD